MSVDDDEPSPALLAELAASAELRDRAFAASATFLRSQALKGAEQLQVYERIRETARLQHAEVRAQIRAGNLDRQAFLTPLELRDHLVEEILDIAYPPLQKLALPREAVSYSPSGLTEILFLIAEAQLGPGKTLVDL